MSNSFGDITELNIDGKDTRVAFSYHYENSGIGGYEFWGTRGFDEGNIGVVVDEIMPIFTNETEEERKLINELINKNFDEYAEEIEEKQNQI